jgi:hypothetical protein
MNINIGTFLFFFVNNINTFLKASKESKQAKTRLHSSPIKQDYSWPRTSSTNLLPTSISTRIKHQYFIYLFILFLKKINLRFLSMFPIINHLLLLIY